MLEVATSLSGEQKRAALEQALTSETFARCDQLRSFLQFVCEQEIAGRAGQITEYLIGVEALGRRASFTPGEDSAVRNRAHALRRKLHEFYAHELPNAPVRIELPKGSYVPRFIEREPHAARDAKEPPPRALIVPPATPPLTIPTFAPRSSRRRFLGLALSFVVGAALTGLAAALLWRPTRSGAATTPRIAPVVREAWGPLLAPDANVLICVATPAQTLLRQYEVKPSILNLYDAPPELSEFYRRRFPSADDHNLYQIAHQNSPMWGDALGALTAASTLSAAGASFQVLPERVTPFPSLRGRNLILFGMPEYSEAVTRLLGAGAFEITYHPPAAEKAISARGEPASESSVFVPERDANHRIMQTYGLITVLSDTDPKGSPQRTVIFSGIGSAGAQAASEFFSSAPHLLDLQKRFREAGQDDFPRAYQVVVKSTSSATLPLDFSYVAHRVLQ